VTVKQLTNRRYSLGVGLGGEALRYFSGWIIAGAVLAVAAPLIIGQFTPVSISVWAIAVTAGKWFSATVAGGFLYALLPILVAQGVTRREITVAMGLLGLIWSAALGALVILGYTAEQVYFSWFDWQQTRIGWGGEDTYVSSVGEAFTGVLPAILSFALFFVFGALLGAAIYRWDGNGLFTLIPAVPVALAFDAALFPGSEPFGPRWLQFVTGFAVEWPFPAAAVGTVVVIALVAARPAPGRGGRPTRGKAA
jgi:hypothetical protein